MNYLAHLYFGRNTEASLVGNLMADFVKGNEESLRESYPDAVVDGIIMHRKIDKFTDDHKLFKETKILLSSRVVRYSGIVVDVFFDHFLAKHWGKYGASTLEDFVEKCHTTLTAHPDWHSQEFKERLPNLIENNVLLSYLDKSGVKIALERIAARANRELNLVDAYEDFERNYGEFEKIFFEFFPLVKNYAATLSPTSDLLETEEEPLSDEELLLLWNQHAVMMAEKEYRKESIISLYTSKGVSKEAASQAAEQLLANAKANQQKLQRILLVPGIIFLILAPAIGLSHFYIPVDVIVNTPLRNVFGGILTAAIGYLLINRSQSMR